MSIFSKNGTSRGYSAWDQQKRARLLFFTGWGITLTYLPSGLLHFLLGPGVYARDGLLFIHLAACVVWLVKSREWEAFARSNWLLLLPAFIVLPAFLDAGSRVEALTFVKWAALWVDWIILGRLAAFAPGFTPLTKVLLCITGLLLVADLVAGAYERYTGAFIFAGMAGQTTAFGVELGREQTIGQLMRVKGLQRDVFSYANLMGMGTVLGLLGIVNLRSAAWRLPALVWAGAFVSALLMSGGRSAFFGVLASFLVALSLMFAADTVRKYYPHIILGWLVIAVGISFIGVGTLVESVGGSAFDSSGVGNATSAYQRDDAWSGIIHAIEQVPVVLVFGSSLSSLFDSKIETFYHWADNQYLWLLYHTGIAGFLALVWYFRGMVTDRADESRVWVRDAVVLSLLYVMGEAIARESLTFIGCLPLFAAVGYYASGQPGEGAGRAPKTRPPEQRPRRSSSSSDVSDFSRRIRARAKQKT